MDFSFTLAHVLIIIHSSYYSVHTFLSPSLLLLFSSFLFPSSFQGITTTMNILSISEKFSYLYAERAKIDQDQVAVLYGSILNIVTDAEQIPTNLGLKAFINQYCILYSV